MYYHFPFFLKFIEHYIILHRMMMIPRLSLRKRTLMTAIESTELLTIQILQWRASRCQLLQSRNQNQSTIAPIKERWSVERKDIAVATTKMSRAITEDGDDATNLRQHTSRASIQIWWVRFLAFFSFHLTPHHFFNCRRRRHRSPSFFFFLYWWRRRRWRWWQWFCKT